MRYRTVNKDIACTPFPNRAVEATKTHTGFLVSSPRTNLVPLTVLASYSPMGLRPGDTIYSPLEFSQSAWGKRRLTVEGVEEFILVPAEHVYLISIRRHPAAPQETPSETPRPEATSTPGPGRTFLTP